MKGKLLLFSVEKLGLRSTPGQIPESEDGEENAGGSLHDKQPAPRVQTRALDVKDTKGKESRECIGLKPLSVAILRSFRGEQVSYNV